MVTGFRLPPDFTSYIVHLVVLIDYYGLELGTVEQNCRAMGIYWVRVFGMQTYGR